MKPDISPTVRRFGTLFFALAAGVTSGADPSPEASPEIIRVEEDWIVYVTNPDSLTGAPQIANVIAPRSSTDGTFGIVELNHGSQPNFSSGGVQVQSWSGEQPVSTAPADETGVLAIAYDKLVYTVAMELSGDEIRFTLKDGKSRTWGHFARQGVSAAAPKNDLTLQDYDPQFSVDNTSINVGAHRVDLMYQKETRYYSAAGLERRDTTPRVLHRFREVVQFVSLEEYEQNQDYFNIEITE